MTESFGQGMRITTREGLADWLAEERSFDDGRLYSYRPEPASPAPSEVYLELGRWAGGGIDPGHVMTFRTFQITARGVKHFSISPPGFNPEHWSEGVELQDEGLGFTVDVPGLLRITFDALEVVQVSDRSVVVEPWVSDHEFWVSVTDGSMPSAEDWTRITQSDARWNFCGGDTETGADHPAPFGYEGWCLQSRQAGALEEAFFFSCRKHKPTGYSLSIRRQGAPGQLWNVVREAAASNPTATIRAGNVEFNAFEWRQYLASGTVPAQPRGWSKAK